MPYRRGKSPSPPYVASLVNAHHNAVEALIRYPDECESVVRVIVPADLSGAGETL